MYELIQAGPKTFYINCPSKIGIYVLNDQDVLLIDSGNHKEMAKKILKILNSQNWNLKYIINTHSHADHIGGNNFLQDKTECNIYSAKMECPFVENPFLESSYLSGGYPCKELRNKFLLAQPSVCGDVDTLVMPEGMEIVPLYGHSYSMIGVKTPDDIYFIADSVASERVLNKYHIYFLYDLKSHLETLQRLETLNGKLFIPSHADAVEDVEELVNINRSKIYEVINKICKICQEPSCVEDVLKHIMDEYDLKLDINQYVLVGSTIRSYLSYLYDEGRLEFKVDNNKLLWGTVGS